jgi:hypothetical protein
MGACSSPGAALPTRSLPGSPLAKRLVHGASIDGLALQPNQTDSCQLSPPPPPPPAPAAGGDAGSPSARKLHLYVEWLPPAHPRGSEDSGEAPASLPR